MANTWRTVRIFVSSTFRDMHAERDHLVKFVFPELRRRLLPHRVYLDDIDLRWGVTKEQAENDRTLNICLQQIDECSIFVGLLGERYGSVPTSHPREALDQFPWLKEPPVESFTELEILHGVLNSPELRQRSFFYFRTPTVLKDVAPDVRDAIYADTDLVAIQKQATLKDRIRRGGWPLRDGYSAEWDAKHFDRANQVQGRITGLGYFGMGVEADLWGGLCAEVGISDTVDLLRPNDALLSESDEHERFLESRLRVFVGRKTVYDALARYASSSLTQPCLLSGNSGSGKTALLAQFVTRFRDTNPGVRVLPHFVGASPRSGRLRDLLRRLCRELSETASVSGLDSAELDYESLIVSFRLALQAAASRAPLLLVFDALEQMEPEDQPYHLHWLPSADDWPANLRVILSVAADTNEGRAAIQALEKRAYVREDIPLLSEEERYEIVARVPLLSAKSLDASQQRKLVENPASGVPLFLQTALEELRGFGSFEQLTARIDHFPSGPLAVRGLFGQALEHLEQEYSEPIVRDVLTLLTCAHRGLSDRELYELICNEPPGGSPLFASMVYRAQTFGKEDLFAVLRWLRPHLVQRRELTAIHSRGLLEAISERYLSSDENRRAAHQRLADYFGALQLIRSITDEGFLRYCPNLDAMHAKRDELMQLMHERFETDLRLFPSRKVDELPWQLVKLQDWRRLYDALADPMFFTISSLEKSQFHWYWTQIETHSNLRLIEAYGPIIRDPTSFPDDAFRVALLLKHYGYVYEATKMWTTIIAAAEASGAAPNFLASAWSQKGQLLLEDKQLDDAEQAISKAAHYFEVSGVPPDSSDALDSLIQRANILRQRGRDDSALELLDRHERLCRGAGAQRSLSIGLSLRGFIVRGRGEIDAALACFRQSEQICREINFTEGVTVALQNQALTLRAQGDFASACGVIDAANQSSDLIGIRREKLARIQREMTEQEKLGQAGVECYQQLHAQYVALEDQGDYTAALANLVDQEAVFRNVGAMTHLAYCLIFKARLLAGPLARPEEGQVALRDAQQIVERHDLQEHRQLLRMTQRFVEGAMNIPMPPPLILQPPSPPPEYENSPDVQAVPDEEISPESNVEPSSESGDGLGARLARWIPWRRRDRD